jgi:hypothetical protein
LEAAAGTSVAVGENALPFALKDGEIDGEQLLFPFWCTGSAAAAAPMFLLVG